jgi:hypothetical protein
MTSARDFADGLVTSRYQTWRPSDGVPIRSTVGAPKFWRGPELIHLREITPYGVFGKGLDPDEASHLYRARLDRHADKIITDLAAIARQHPGQALVVLCYENVHAGQSCHRRWFAEWCHQRHGLVVPELPAPLTRGIEGNPGEGGGQQQLF